MVYTSIDVPLWKMLTCIAKQFGVNLVQVSHLVSHQACFHRQECDRECFQWAAGAFHPNCLHVAWS